MAGTNTRVKLEGASQYKKDLQNIGQQSKTLKAEMDALTSGFTDATSAQEKQEKATEKLNQQIENQEKYIKTLKDAIEAESQKTGENSTQTLKLKESLAKAETSLNGMKTQVENVGKEEDNAKQKTFNFGDALKANIASDAITKMVEGLATAVKKVATEIKSAYTGSVQWADDLATLSVQTGISTEALQEYQYMSGIVDVSVDTVTGSLTKLKKNMLSAQDGTGTAAEAFEALGTSVTDSDGNLRDSQEVFTEVLSALGEMTNETERDATAMEIFGKSAQELNPMIEAGTDAINAFRQEAHDVGYVMSNDVISSLVESANATDRTTAQFDAFKREISAGLAPQISELQTMLLDMFREIDLDAVRTNISNIVSKFGEFCSWCKSNKDTIIALFAGIAAGFSAFEIGTIIMQVIGWMKEFETVQMAVNAVMAANPILLIASAIAILVAGIILLVKNWDTVKEKAIEVWEVIKSSVSTAVEAVKSKFSEIVSGLKANFEEIKSNIAEWVANTIVNPIKDKISAVISIGKNLVEGLWNGINDKVQWIKDKISGFCDNVKEWFKTFFGIHSPSRETAWMGEMLVEGLANGIRGGTNTINSAWQSATSGIGADATASTGGYGGTAVGGGVVNLYAQTIDDATIDYIYTRINGRMGAYS